MRISVTTLLGELSDTLHSYTIEKFLTSKFIFVVQGVGCVLSVYSELLLVSRVVGITVRDKFTSLEAFVLMFCVSVYYNSNTFITLSLSAMPFNNTTFPIVLCLFLSIYNVLFKNTPALILTDWLSKCTVGWLFQNYLVSEHLCVVWCLCNPGCCCCCYHPSFSHYCECVGCVHPIIIQTIYNITHLNTTHHNTPTTNTSQLNITQHNTTHHHTTQHTEYRCLCVCVSVSVSVCVCVSM